MVGRFEFATAGRLIFGWGVTSELPAAVAGRGHRALVVTGRDMSRHAEVLAALDAAGLRGLTLAVPGEPSIDWVRGAVGQAVAAEVDVVVGLGGGSALDAGKAVAALVTNDGDVLDYLEVIGQGRPLTRPPLPFIAVPTTAGTGSEVTRNAVLGSAEHGVKASLRSPLMLPAVALVDPALTVGVPPAVSASTGLDAITQLVEPYVCARATPMTDALCLDGLAVAARALPRACADGTDAEARTGMAYASVLGGMALANAGLGVVHGLAAAIGGACGAPHGAICAALLAHGMAANLRACGQDAAGEVVRTRYARVARVLTGQPHATADDGVAWVTTLVRQLPVAQLGDLGVRDADAPALAAAAARASSMRANPVPLSVDALADIIRAAR